MIYTCLFRCRCKYRYTHIKISKWPFPWILSVWYGQEGVSSKDEKFVWYDFSCSLMHIGFWQDVQSHRTTLLGIYMFKGNNKNIRTIYETCLKLKLKNKYSETTLSNGVLLSLLLPFERIFHLILVFLLLTLKI